MELPQHEALRQDERAVRDVEVRQRLAAVEELVEVGARLLAVALELDMPRSSASNSSRRCKRSEWSENRNSAKTKSGNLHKPTMASTMTRQ